MTISLAMKEKNKARWGDQIDDDDTLDFLLPAKQVIGPDDKGIKKTIESKYNDEGKTVKITTTTRVRKAMTMTLIRMGARSKRIAERRTRDKFGDAVHDDDDSRLTMVSTEEIFLERPKALSGTKPEESKESAELGRAGAVLMICRNCGKKGDHWTARCPKKVSTRTASAGTSKAGSYVPPSMREGADRSLAGSDMRNSVRVSNLSEDACDADLRDLFGSFGDVTRAHVALDYKTGKSRTFGFVNFVSREDAQRAMNKLNGYGYDNLILEVQWAICYNLRILF